MILPITLTNPDLLELHSACVLYVPEFAEIAKLFPSPASLILHTHAFSSRNDFNEEMVEIEVKCKGLGCKSREVIGRGRAETYEKAAMIALLDMNGVKTVYTK